MDGEEPQPIIDMEGVAPDMEGMEGAPADMEGMDGEMEGMDGEMDGMNGEMDGMDGMDDMEGDADAPVVDMDDRQAEMSESPSDAAGRDHSKDPSKFSPLSEPCLIILETDHLCSKIQIVCAIFS